MTSLAFTTIALKESTFKLAPPTRAPSTSGLFINSVIFSGLTLPPYCILILQEVSLSLKRSIKSRINLCASCACCGVAVLSLGVPFFAPLWRLKKVVAVRDRQYFDQLHAAGRSIILLAPHFITLDIGGMRAGYDKNFVCMYRKARDPLLEFLFQRRTRSGAVLVDRLANLKSLIRYIRDGRPFYYLPDQDMGERASVFVPFFGVPAATVTALSRIAESTNAAVLPCVSRILPYGGGFEVRFYPPFDNFPTKDPVADAARMNLEIEQWVRAMPEQYMWSYRRFKTRPNNEPSLYKK